MLRAAARGVALPNVPLSVFTTGATGNGTTDDAPAINAALALSSNVYFPPGFTYRVASSIVVPANCAISGGGINSIIQADNNTYDVFQVNQSYTKISNLKIQNGLAGVRYIGLAQPVVQNSLEDVSIWGAANGIVLDGGSSFSFPCYWNNFNRVLIAQPTTYGILLTKSGAGDTPNSNRFYQCRVYSLGANITGDGIYVQYGNYNNEFVGCESNLATTANSCVHLGANANQTLFTNLYTETTSTVTNVLLDSGSGSVSKNVITNLLPASAGAAIADNSGQQYIAQNANTTTTSGNWFVPSINIGFPTNVVANTLNAPFQIHGLNSNTSNMGMFIYTNNSVGTRISMNKSRSTTIGLNGAVNINDDIGYLDYNANDNSHYLASAQVKASVDQSVSASQGYVAGRLVFLTSPQNNGGLLEAMRIDSNQNVIHGTAALATSATNGFTYIATCAGAPTGTPTAYTGRVPMVYDTTNHKFWIYDTAWKGVVVS